LTDFVGMLYLYTETPTRGTDQRPVKGPRNTVQTESDKGEKQ